MSRGSAEGSALRVPTCNRRPEDFKDEAEDLDRGSPKRSERARGQDPIAEADTKAGDTLYVIYTDIIPRRPPIQL